MKILTSTLLWVMALAVPVVSGLTWLLIDPALAQSADHITAATDAGSQAGWAMIGAAISAGLASLGAAYAVAVVGSAAVGVLAEKPEMLGRLLILVGLAEGIAIYGLIVAVLILNKV